MNGINRVILIGYLGQDPDIRYGQDGKAVANISIATTESWKSKETGEKVEKTEWHKVVAFGRTAEVMGEYLAKGSLVYIEGKLRTEKWQDKEGNDRYTTKVYCDVMHMLGSRDNAADKGKPMPKAQRKQPEEPAQEEFMDDPNIPF